MIELGLQRISRLLAKTPLPWRAIHIAGTNGKGSICTYISGMLDVYNRSTYRQQSGLNPLKHARFMSPHLIHRWDCITIDQQTVPFSLFDHIETQVRREDQSNDINATEFELLTAIAFEIFTQQDIDVAVVEVGMGGRLDATNLIGQPTDQGQYGVLDSTPSRPPPLVTAISKIGLDHQAFLGNTIADIAREKAGIIKAGVPVVYDPSNTPEVVDVIKSASDGRAMQFREDLIPMPHMPSHTTRNAGVAFLSTWLALEQLERLSDQSTRLSKDDYDMLANLANDMIQVPLHTSVPGRLQYVSIEHLTGRRNPVLLDGAHNGQSADILASEVDQMWRTKGGNVTWVTSASDSKDVAEILRPLLRAGDSVFTVEFGPVDGMPWVKPTNATALLNAAKRIIGDGRCEHLQACSDQVLLALRAASEAANEGPLVIAGSLYLVGDVLRYLRDSKE